MAKCTSHGRRSEPAGNTPFARVQSASPRPDRSSRGPPGGRSGSIHPPAAPRNAPCATKSTADRVTRSDRSVAESVFRPGIHVGRVPTRVAAGPSDDDDGPIMRPSFRPQRVLLTGASGTIGNLIGPALLAAGVPLRVLVHRRRPAWLPRGADVEERTGDVLEPATLRGAADGCDAIVHAAARPGFGALDRERRQRIHIEGTEAVLGEASSAGSRLFALIGYTGTIQERSAPAPVDEEQPPEGDYESAYVRMKMESEVLTLEANRPGQLRTLVVSPGVLFGPGLPSILTELTNLYL